MGNEDVEPLCRQLPKGNWQGSEGEDGMVAPKGSIEVVNIVGQAVHT